MSVLILCEVRFQYIYNRHSYEIELVQFLGKIPCWRNSTNKIDSTVAEACSWMKQNHSPKCTLLSTLVYESKIRLFAIISSLRMEFVHAKILPALMHTAIDRLFDDSNNGHNKNRKCTHKGIFCGEFERLFDDKLEHYKINMTELKWFDKWVFHLVRRMIWQSDRIATECSSEYSRKISVSKLKATKERSMGS